MKTDKLGYLNHEEFIKRFNKIPKCQDCVYKVIRFIKKNAEYEALSFCVRYQQVMEKALACVEGFKSYSQEILQKKEKVRVKRKTRIELIEL